MNQSRTAILVGFIIILAFIAGYKGETLAQYMSLTRVRALFTAASGALFKPHLNPTESASGGASSLPGIPVVGGSSNSTMNMPQGNSPIVRGGVMSSLPMGGFQYSSIPYGTTTSAHTITNPQGDETTGGVAKNAYFEKLSEQMRELRQQNMVQTFSVPSEPSPGQTGQMFSSAPGFTTPSGIAPEHFPMEAPPPPTMMPPAAENELDSPTFPPAMPPPVEESEDIGSPEVIPGLDE